MPGVCAGCLFFFTAVRTVVIIFFSRIERVCHSKRRPGDIVGVRLATFKVAKACVVLSAHVLALNDQTDFAFLELAVFTFDLVVKPGGENFVLRGKRRSEDLYPALATIESVHFRCFSYEPRWLERTTDRPVIGGGSGGQGPAEMPGAG